MLSSVCGTTGLSSISPQAPAESGAFAQRQHRPIRVLVLIPTLNVGGAEMDLVRTLPKIDRDRFQVTVCTFLERGELSKVLQDQGIEVIGPFSALYPLRQLVRRIVQSAALIFRSILPLLKRVPLLPKSGFRFYALRHATRTCFNFLRVLYSSPKAVAYLMEVVRIARPIARYIRASEIDVVHTVLPNSYLVGGCAAALAGRRPLLMSRLSLNLYQQRYKLVGLIERRILHRTVDAVIGNSNAVLRDLRAEKINESKLHLVYNGIDVCAFANEMVDRSTARRQLGISAGALVFSVVANLHPYKGHRDLLPALAALSGAWQSDWLCLFVGKDVHDHLPELKRLSRQYGVSRNVGFLGPRADVPIILSASDIHISASHQEGMPNNIIEAMCARLPVVATAVGGVPELVVHGETGYLLPPQDAGRMTGALLALAQAPRRRKAFGEAGYARVASHFNIDNNVGAIESIYAGLAGSHRYGRSPGHSCSPDLRIAAS